MKNILGTFFAVLFFGQKESQNLIQKDDFLNPPQSSQVNTWWHWISGNVSKDGITKDLESMKRQGIKQATILNIGAGFGAKLDMPQVKFNSPEWYAMFQFALKEANRLGLTIGVHNCDGWSASGGPWITPETSMKTVTWTKTYLKGGETISKPLAKPEAEMNYYVDYAVVAFPAKQPKNSFQTANPKVRLNKENTAKTLFDGNPITNTKIQEGDSLVFSFDKEFTASKLNLFRYFIRPSGVKPGMKSSYELYSSNDGTLYKKVASLETKGINRPQEQNFPTTTAKFFKLKVLKSTFTKGQYLSEIELLPANEEPFFTSNTKDYLAQISKIQSESNPSDFQNNSVVNAIAENDIIDLTPYMSKEGVLNWKAPKGDWCVIRFGYTTTGVKNQPATPEGSGLECDKLDASAVTLHFNSFPKKLVASSGDYLGTTFKFLLVDSWEAQFQNWTKDFPEEFNKRRGYNLIKWIPVLCGETIGNSEQTDAFLHDFRKTIADLIEDNYYKKFSELCHDNKLELHSEVIYGKSHYPPLDVFSASKYVDLPMTEFWAWADADRFPVFKPSSGPLSIFPTYTSFTSGKQIIGSEAYTGFAEYSETPALLKPFGDMMYSLGINQMILHSYVHQPNDKKPGLTLGKFGGAFNRNNPWWEYSQGWLTYQSRVQYIMQKGTPKVDIVTYVGDEQPQTLNNITNIPFGYTVYPCSFEMLNEQAEIIDGQLVFNGKQKIPFLALPTIPMELATLKRIALLVNDGLVVCGEKPVATFTLSEIKKNAEEFNQLADKLWGTTKAKETKYGKGKVINIGKISEMITYLKLTPDFATNTNNSKEIMYMHKTLGDQEVFFVFNQTKEAITRELLFKVKDKTPEIWKAENGTAESPVIYTIEGNLMRIPVTFKANESMFFVFNAGTSKDYIKKVSLDGKQLFPSLKNENVVEIPSAEFQNGDYNFKTKVPGNYTFSTISDKEIKKNLVQPKVFEIKNYKANLEFTSISNETIAPVELTKLKSFTEFENQAIKYFAGKVKYTIRFSAPKDYISKESITLNLGAIDATAEVRLNGNLINYAWLSNAEINISGMLQENNELVITLANVCRNRIIGDKIMYNEYKNIITTVKYNETVGKDMPLSPSGVMGPLTLTMQ